MSEEFFLIPLGSRAIIEMDGYDYKGAIIIPDIAKRKTTTGRIIAMGSEHEQLQVGQRVLFDQFAGGPFEFQGQDKKEYRHMSYDEIVAIVRE